LQTAKLINAWYSRDWDRVAAIVERTTAPATETPSYWALLGVIRRTEGKADEARRCFEEAKRLGEAALVNDPRDSEALNELALAEAGLGRGEEAVRRVQRSLEIMPLETDALIAPRTELRFAEVMAIAGDREAALQNLKEIVKLPFALFYGDLKLSPIWDGIRDDPRFAAILDSARQPLPLTE
jgi:tetratricopeptide (TPR) repeat protein